MKEKCSFLKTIKVSSLGCEEIKTEPKGQYFDIRPAWLSLAAGS